MDDSFFPDTVPDLYGVLSLARTCTSSDITRAYRKCALLFHPDRLASSSSSAPTPAEITSANLKFQQVGFAYSVLKDDARRKRYDATGRTDEGLGGEAKSEEEWREYFKQLWKGTVDAQSIDEFTKNYQGSEEEAADVLEAYTTSHGDLETILSTIMCSTISDEARFVTLINDAISSGKLVSTPKWKKSLSDTKAREKRVKKAEKEAGEAEKYAKELGVHDELFGNKSKGKGKGKGGEGEDAGEEALKALILKNGKKRMGGVIEGIEAKYAKIEEDKKAARGKGKGKGKVDKKEEGPTEEEFERIQKEMEERKKAGTKKSAGGVKRK